MRAIIGPNLLSSKVAQPTKSPLRSTTADFPVHIAGTAERRPVLLRSVGRNRRITLGRRTPTPR